MNDFLFYLDAFKGPIALALAWIIAFWIGPKFYVDSFRQEMFALRDEMFSDAAHGLISFNHPAYGMLRSTMNGFIRYAHELSLSHVFILMWQLRGISLPKESMFQHRWTRYTSSINEEARTRLNEYKGEMEDLVAKQLVLGSPLLLALLVPWLVAHVLVRFCKRWVSRAFSGPIQSLDETAMVVGEAA